MAVDVMLCDLSDDGHLQKAVNVAGMMHIIEEIQLFPEQQPVQNIELDSAKVCVCVCLCGNTLQFTTLFALTLSICYY